MGLLLSIVCWIFIVWSDFKDRTIPVWLMSVATLLAGVYVYDHLEHWREVVVNILLMLIHLGLVALWLKIRRKNLRFFDEAIGWGDVWMMLIAACYFTPLHFIVMICLAAVLGLLYALMCYRFCRQQKVLIPLAAFIAILLLCSQAYLYVI